MQRFSGMVMAVARSCRLDEADVAEVHQMTWLRLVENIGRIEQPASWSMAGDDGPTGKPPHPAGQVAGSFDHEGLMLRSDLTPNRSTRDHWPTSSPRPCSAPLPCCHRTAEAHRNLGPRSPLLQGDLQALLMPIGSIGPTRGRCLEHLRRIIEEIGADV